MMATEAVCSKCGVPLTDTDETECFACWSPASAPAEGNGRGVSLDEATPGASPGVRWDRLLAIICLLTICSTLLFFAGSAVTRWAGPDELAISSVFGVLAFLCIGIGAIAIVVAYLTAISEIESTSILIEAPLYLLQGDCTVTYAPNSTCLR